MTNLAELFSADNPHPIEILNPLSGEKMGIVINVVSSDSPRVVNALRVLQVKRMRSNATNQDDDRDLDSDIATYMISQEDEIVRAAIVSWDWGGESWDHISGSGDADSTSVDYLIDHPHSGWIKRQILAGVQNIENFTKPSSKSAPKKPRK